MRVIGARWSMPAWAGWTSRVARIVVMEIDGAIGVGEAAPLPGRSRETIAMVDAALDRAAGVRWPDGPLDLARAADEVCAGAPSAAWAVFSAVIDARARARKRPAAMLIAPTPAHRLPLAAVVDSPAAARAAVERGARTLKIKIAPPVRLAVERVAQIRAAVGPAISLRVDGNQQFAVADVPALLDRLAPLGIEFVEEPAAGLPLDQPTSPPLALDESLADSAYGGLGTLGREAVELGASPRSRRQPASPCANEDVTPGPAVAALVLKPTILGPTRTLTLCTTRRTAVISHALEGPVAVAAAVELAIALTHAAAGLDAHPGLTAWKVAIPALGPASLDDVVREGTGLDIARVLERARRLT